MAEPDQPVVSRGFRGRPPAEPERLPPGQYLTRDFPVLATGPTPIDAAEDWRVTISGAVERERAWSWDEFQALPSETFTVDIHCVTQWSKLDTTWTGVPLDALLAEAGPQGATHVLAHCTGGYTTNLPLADVSDGRAWIASGYLAGELQAGDRFEIRGPGGRSFSWHVEDAGPLLLVAGGAGLVPLRAMLRHRLAQGADLETCLVLSVRSEEGLLYRDELAEWEAAGVQVVVTFTRTGPRRRVDRELLGEAGQAAHVFVCGSTGFVESAAALLMGLGHDPARVRTERFGGAA